MITELELPQDRFNVVKLKDIKKKTFIYGKNGTGKSSIVECIQKQYSNEYDIKVFQGYEQIIADYWKTWLNISWCRKCRNTKANKRKRGRN